MSSLTSRQAQILALISTHIEETGFPPTRAEIAQTLGFKSANAAEEHLKALARKGAIEIIPGTSRGIRVVKQEQGLPIVGRVAAGHPILAVEHIDEYCAVANTLFHPPADYLLTVQGDSMIEVGIIEGDLLAVHKTQQANDGDIIIARLNDEVTVKRLKKTQNDFSILLMPENKTYQAINVDLRYEDFTIEGISVGLIRR